MKLRWGLFAKLVALNLGIVVAATLAAGIGVREFALYVITSHDMMAEDHIPPFLRDTDRYMAILVLVTVVLAGLAVWRLTRSLVSPLMQIESVAARVAGGDYRPRVHASGRDEIAQLARSINRMTESLQRIESLRRDMVANVAHDLRTPLTALQGLLQAMRDGYMALTPASLEQLHEEVDRLVRLVEDLHRLSRSDALRQEPLELSEIDLGDLLRDLAAQMQPLLDERGIRVRLEADAGLAQVQADRDRLVQILVNLLDNVHKYAPARSWCRIGVQQAEPGLVRVTVANPDPGVDPATLPLLFERFYRGEKSRSRATGGAGIGLAIVRNLVESHGGGVGAESDPGEVRFWFTLPESQPRPADGLPQPGPGDGLPSN